MDSDTYDSDLQYYIYCVYIIAIVIWCILISVFRIGLEPCSPSWLLLIVFIPIVIFVIGLFNCEKFDHMIGKCMFQTPIITICIILAVQYIYWIIKSESPCDMRTSTHMLSLITLSIILVLLSSLDIWSNQKMIVIWNHLRHTFQTMAIVVAIYSIILYCVTINRYNLVGCLPY